eukprot:jgi/Chrpa1/19312/Chrysochromulina_OHIO_Genome00007316-RA
MLGAGSDTWDRARGGPQAASAAATAEAAAAAALAVHASAHHSADAVHAAAMAEAAAAALVAALASLSAAGIGSVTGSGKGAVAGPVTNSRTSSSELNADESLLLGISPIEIFPTAAPPRVEGPSPAPSLSESDGETFDGEIDGEIESSRLPEPCNLDENLDDGLVPVPQRLSRRQQLMALVTMLIVLLQPLIAMGIVHRRYYYASARTEKQLTLIAANSAREAAFALVRWY